MKKETNGFSLIGFLILVGLVVALIGVAGATKKSLQKTIPLSKKSLVVQDEEVVPAEKSPPEVVTEESRVQPRLPPEAAGEPEQADRPRTETKTPLRTPPYREVPDFPPPYTQEAMPDVMADPLSPETYSYCLSNPADPSCSLWADLYGDLIEQTYGPVFGQPQPQPSYLNPLNDPGINPLADPNINPLMDPRINPLADPNLNPLADPSLNPGCLPCSPAFGGGWGGGWGY